MKKYQKTLHAFYDTETGRAIPDSAGNRHYRQMQEEIENGDAELLPYVAPEPTQTQIDAQLKQDGVMFEGILCSATAEDMWGLASIKDWVRAGSTTNFHFSNGAVLKLGPHNIDAFEATWVPFRASFFE